MDQESFLRGLLRGFTSDMVGGVPDIMEQLVNLGLAGYGFAGHKMGLLNADQLPKLLEASPGTSEWFARKAGNPDNKTAEYTYGRLAPLALTAGNMAHKAGGKLLADKTADAAKGLARWREENMGVLNPSVGPRAIQEGGAPDLYLGHSGTVDRNTGWRRLADKGPALYGNSFGLTAGKVPNFSGNLDSGGGILLVPRLGALDPATYDTRIWNRDAYTLRSKEFPGFRALQNNPQEYAHNALKERGLVRANLAFSEGETFGSHLAPHKSHKDESHKAVLINSPEFRSFADFEASPAGAATLRKKAYDYRDMSADVFREYKAAVLLDAARKHYPNMTPEEGDQVDQLLTKLLYYPRDSRARALGKMAVKDPDFAKELGGLAKEFRARFSVLPSEYGEVQNYGLLPITPENFAGAFVTEWEPGSYSLAAQRSLGQVPVIGKTPGEIKTSDLDGLLREAGPARSPRKGLISSFGGFRPSDATQTASVPGWSGALPKPKAVNVGNMKPHSEAQILSWIEQTKAQMAEEVAGGQSSPSPYLLQDLADYEAAYLAKTGVPSTKPTSSSAIEQMAQELAAKGGWEPEPPPKTPNFTGVGSALESKLWELADKAGKAAGKPGAAWPNKDPDFEKYDVVQLEKMLQGFANLPEGSLQNAQWENILGLLDVYANKLNKLGGPKKAPNLSKFTQQNLDDGVFDYVPDSDIKHMMDTALANDDDFLGEAINAYNNVNLSGWGSPQFDAHHDHALQNLLKLWNPYATGKQLDLSGLFGGKADWAQKSLFDEVALTLTQAYPTGVPSEILQAAGKEMTKYWGPASPKWLKEDVQKHLAAPKKPKSAVGVGQTSKTPVLSKAFGPDWDVGVSEGDLAFFYNTANAETQAKLDVEFQALPSWSLETLKPLLQKAAPSVPKAAANPPKVPLAFMNKVNTELASFEHNTAATVENLSFHIPPANWSSEQITATGYYLVKLAEKTGKPNDWTNPLYKAFSDALAAKSEQENLVTLEALKFLQESK